MLILIPLMSLSAFADTYDAELAIPSEHPAWMKASYAPTYRRFLHKLDPEDDPGDGSVSSTDSRVTCHVKDSWVILQFTADRANWPTTLPLSASCSYGGDTLEIDVVAFASEVDPAFQEMEIQAGDVINITRITDALVLRSFPLPECESEFVTGTYAVSGLENVSCRAVYWDGAPQVQVRALPSATMGVGTCELPLADQSKYSLTINLDEHDP